MAEKIVIREAVKKIKEDILLNQVSVTFEAGKIHGVIGRNGSGKTVLFKCICGFMALSSGYILVDGKRIGKELDVPSDVGIIIEAPGFLPGYSGYKNLKLLSLIQKKITSDKIESTMIRVGLDPKSKKRVGKYSLGMRQRLGIAQAIMENPSLLVLDEPMNGLDKRGVEEIRQLLIALRDEGKTILLASHSSEDINLLCDSVYEMDAGSMTKVR